MKIKFSFLLILGLSFLNAKPVDNTVTFGIVYPWSTNKTKQESTNLNLSLFQNSVGDIAGANISGLSAISNGNVNGIQASLLYSQINKTQKGASFSTINVVNENVQGAQGAFAANLLGKSFSGYQVAGAINFIGGNFKGYQQSAVFNIVGKDFYGMQSGVAGNVVGGDFKGAQFGTTFNFVARKMVGLQTASLNVCAELKGVQLGIGNITQINRGWQIGFMNLAEQQEGVPIGLINISDDGNICWQNYISNFAGFVTAIRFESNNFVSSLEMGAPNLESEIEESVLLGFHYGYRIPWRRLGFETDLGFFHVIYEPDNGKSDIPNSFALQLRFSASLRITNYLSVFTGIGGTTMAEYPDLDDEDAETVTTEDRLLYFFGLNLF